MENKSDKKILIILIIIIVASIIGVTYFVYSSKKISKENAIRYEEEKDKPEFNALKKNNISICKFSNIENSEYFITFYDVFGSSGYYPIGINLPENIILSKKLKDSSQIMIVNDKALTIKNKIICGYRNSYTLWDIHEITNNENIINELLKDENNYYKIKTSDLITDRTLLN